MERSTRDRNNACLDCSERIEAFTLTPARMNVSAIASLSPQHSAYTIVIENLASEQPLS